jgi:TolB-like protein
MSALPSPLSFRRGVALRAGVRLMLFAATATAVSAAELKRRVLVLPFDNTLKNKNYNWMSDSIAQNLKDDLLKSERFEVLDVTLLRKIDPNMKFQNLDAKNASAVAARLNCEVAVVGRFSVRKDGKKEIVTFEADGVDALEAQTVVVKNTEAPINAEIFDTVDKLAQSISDELATKLRPLDAASFKRNNKLEILIRRLENPPKGFFDDLQIIGLKLNPAFDIDTFEYEVAMTYDDMKEFPKVKFEYQYWGDRKTPVVTTEKLDCKNEDCTITGHLPVLKLAASKKPDAVSYTLRFRTPDPRGPIIGRWWVTAGYPYMKSFAVAGQSNPDAIEPGSKLQLDAMKGFGFLEAGIVPGRWQFLPWNVRYALTMQAGYGQGEMAQYLPDNPTKVKIQLLTVGGGVRLDRLFQLGRVYSLAPYIGYTTHYQRYFRQIDTGFLQTVGFAPEAGLNQYFRLGRRSPWQLMFTLAAGSYIYSGQSLFYGRVALGVEYVIK